MLIAGLLLAAPPARAQTAWVSSGADYRNNHAMNSPTGPQQLNLRSVSGLKTRWFYPTGAGVSSTPTVEPGGLYFVGQDGYVTKLDPDTGALKWRHYISSYVHLNGGATTTSPAIAGDRIVVGIGGWVLALNKTDGSLIWSTQVDPNPQAVVHASPVIVAGQVFTGVASTEEYYTLNNPGYVPSFRGSIVSLSLGTGAINWQTYTVPTGYTGGGVWGSSPVADATRGLVFVTTGNNFTVQPAVGACIRTARANAAAQRDCLDAHDYVDSFLALSMATGAVVWSRATIGADAWLPLPSCADPSVLVCPTVQQPEDVDFAQGPDLFYVHNFIGRKDDRGGTSNSWILGAGQKTGVFWALNPDTGGLFWSTSVITGCCGIQWGHAVDTANNMLYVPVNNESLTIGNNLAGRGGVPVANWKGGDWTGINTATGSIVFQVPAPGMALNAPSVPANTPGGLSVSNGIVFGGTTSGEMVGFDLTGYIHWQFYAGGLVVSAPAIFNDRVYWGVGNYNPPVSGQTYGLYCFAFD